MIQIIADGYCKECECRELEVFDVFEKFDENGDMITSQDVKCIHEEACNRAFWIGRRSQKEQVQ